MKYYLYLAQQQILGHLVFSIEVLRNEIRFLVKQFTKDFEQFHSLMVLYAFSFHLQPFLNKRLFHDTCGVNNLHGMPAILAVIFSAIFAAVASPDNYGKRWAIISFKTNFIYFSYWRFVYEHICPINKFILSICSSQWPITKKKIYCMIIGYVIGAT